MPKTKTRPKRLRKQLYRPLLQLTAVGLAGILLSMIWLLPRSSGATLAYATDVSVGGLLEQTNLQRQQNSKPTLDLNPLLTQAAQTKANDMATGNYWSHTTPEGKDPWVFMEQAGYTYKKAGENLAYGFTSSESTVMGWMNSPTHRSNLLDDSFLEVGFGFVNVNNYQGTKASTVIVAMYGTPLTAVGIQGKAANADQSLSTDTMRIARLQVATDGQAPWSLVVLVALASAAFGVAAFKHSRAIRRTVSKGEKFALHHPMFDAVVIFLAILGYFAASTAGYIL